MSRWDYFDEAAVSDTSFPTTPHANFRFHSQGFTLLNLGAQVVEYSFDGTTLHGQLDTSGDAVEASFTNRVVNKIWFRVASGSSTVRVEGWGISGR